MQGLALLIQQAGIEEQGAPKRFLRVRKTVEVKEGDKWARLEPYEGLRMSFSIEFRHPVIDRSTQSVTGDFAETSYLKEIARARTFGRPPPDSRTLAAMVCATATLAVSR